MSEEYRDVPFRSQDEDNPRFERPPKVEGSVPKKRHELLHWNGWGYKDSGFVRYEGPGSEGRILAQFTGDRYEISGKILPSFIPFIHWAMNSNLTEKLSVPAEPVYQDPIICQEFLDELPSNITRSLEGMDRLCRGHGHTLREIALLRTGELFRIPDLVVWPECHKDVEDIIFLAVKHDVVIIPFGGGTNVTGSLSCPEEEKRMIVSLDMSQMNRILWIDRDGLCAKIEAGIIGKDMEARLSEMGFTVGHEPDSIELSTLGGWVATRASGMKKNRYGNIEDIVISLRAVTPKGEWRSSGQFPRVSTGPEMNHVLLGSEGTLAVITEVVVKIRPVAPVRKCGSYVFPTYDVGIDFMRHVARERCQPASLRLMDNVQYRFGHAMKSESGGYLSDIINSMTMMYLNSWKGIDLEKMAVATIVMEGTAAEVAVQEAQLHAIAIQYEGIAAGEGNGKRGYQMTFAIAYIRDIGLDYGMACESFETSAPWDRVKDVIYNTQRTVEAECTRLNVVGFKFSSRVTQLYDAGACIYFYFALNFISMGIMAAVDLAEHLETVARDEILASGGSLSHHHGVGKVRKKWMKSVLPPTSFQVLQSIKKTVDPKNTLASGNLIF